MPEAHFHYKAGCSGGTIAKLTGTGLYAIQSALITLESLGLVTVERGSRENRYKLNMDHYSVAHGLRALFEGEQRMKQALAKELKSLLEGKVLGAGLFGSFARNTAHAGSDIDVLVVVRTRREYERIRHLLSDAQGELTRRYGLPVQPVIFELARLRRSAGGAELLDEAERDWHPVIGLTPKELMVSA